MKKQVYMMLVATAVLAAVALIALNVGPNKKMKRKQQEPILGQVKIKDIKTIIINDDVRLTKNGDIWSFMQKTSVDGNDEYLPKPTRQDYVQELLSTMTKFSRGQLMDSAPDDLTKYHLSDEDGARVMELKDEQDETLLKIKIGVVVDALSTNYAQIDDNAAVYKVGEGLSDYLNQGSQYWLDLRLFPNGFDTQKIKSIKISKKDNEDIYFTKNKTEWVENDNPDKVVNLDEVETYLNNLSVIRAHSFYSIDLKEGYKNGKIELTLTNDDVLEVQLYFFANKYFVTTVGGQEQEILHFQEYSIEKMFPEKERFMLEEDTAVTEGDTSELDASVDVTDEVEVETTQ